MITDAAKRVASLAGKRTDIPLGRPSFRPEEHYEARDFDAKNFRPIKLSHMRCAPSGRADCARPEVSHMREFSSSIAFLDGGNLPLIRAPSFSVHFERVYFNCFREGKRTELEIPSKLEFFAVLTSSGEGGDVRYEASLIPLEGDWKKYLPDEKDLRFDSYDRTVSTGGERIKIPRIGDVARSFAEWNLARSVCERLSEGDIFVRDGTLHAPYTNQAEYAERAYGAARGNGVLFCGVSKTSHLYTTTGLSLVAAIGRLARENKIKAPGYYENVVRITDPNHRADLNFARLHARSQYTFRIEILKGQEAHKDRIMGALAANSSDISFPGYPYGLVDADRNARVSEDELDSLRTLLLSEIAGAGDFQDFKDLLAASEAHEWLNRIV